MAITCYLAILAASDRFFSSSLSGGSKPRARPPGRVRGEGGKQLVGNVRKPLRARPGTPARQDGEYARGGVANLFMCFELVVGRGRGSPPYPERTRAIT